MSYIDEIFNRCNIEKISNFILYGSECVEASKEGYTERLKKAFKKIDEMLNKEFTDFKKREKQASIIYQFGGELETIYTEIGLQAGLILASQIYGNK